jgi:hypothetical protein
MSVHYGMSGFGSTHYALIRNASKEVRQFALKLNVDPKILRGFTSPTVQIQGTGQPVPLRPDAVLTVPDMKPGERRWVAFDMSGFKAAVGTSLWVDMFELANEKVVNGFRINVTSSTAANALRECVRFNAAVFRRLARQFNLRDAADVEKASTAALKDKTIAASAYLKLLTSSNDAIANSVKSFLAKDRANESDLGVGASLEAFAKALAGKTTGPIFAVHSTLLNKLDIALTLARLRKT